MLAVGASLESTGEMRPASCLVTADFGLLMGGMRYESPDIAAEAASEGQVRDGWNFWALTDEDGGTFTLRELLTR